MFGALLLKLKKTQQVYFANEIATQYTCQRHNSNTTHFNNKGSYLMMKIYPKNRENRYNE